VLLAKEKDVLEEIQRLKKEKKLKRDGSFDASKKRRAALNATKIITGVSSQQQTSDSPVSVSSIHFSP